MPGNNHKMIRHSGGVSALSILILALAAGCNDITGNGDDSADDSDSDSNGSAEAAAEVPVITQLSAEGTPVTPEGQVELAVAANSPSGNALDYDWRIPDDWDGDDTGDNILVLTAPDDSDARAEVQVVVRDGHLSRTGYITVATDDEAVVEDWSVSLDGDEPLQPGDSLDFSVQAHDPQGDPITYSHLLGILLEFDRGSNYDWTLSDDFAVGGIIRASSAAQFYNAYAGMDVAVDGANPWPVRGGNRQRTGMSTSEQATVGDGDIVWESDPVGGEDASSTLASAPPALDADGTLYVGGSEYDSDAHEMDYFVYAIDTSDGSIKWDKPMDESVMSSSPTIGVDGTIYIGAEDGYLYALDPQDGSRLWREDILSNSQYEEPSPMIGSDGTLYIVRSPAGRLKALEDKGEEAEVKWTYDSNSAYTAAALGPDDTIYFGDAEDNLYAINPEEHAQQREKWVFEGDDRFDSSPVVGMDGTIYVGSDDNHLYAINPDGGEKWATDLGTGIRLSPIIGPRGYVYIGLGNTLYGLDPEDGSIAQEHEMEGPIGTDLVMGPDGILYAYVDGSLKAFDPHNDSTVWTVDEGSSDPILGRDGTVYAIKSDLMTEHMIGIR